MDKLTTKLESYLLEILDYRVAITAWEGAGRLPYFLESRYTFLATRIHDQPCLLMVDRDDAETGPAKIRKHMDQVQAKWDGNIVYVREGMTAYNRKRLIERRVPFIVPGNQMYLPMLGIDLREHFRKPRARIHQLRPATQAILIHMLLRGESRSNLAELARLLGYTAMTMSRGFDELQASELGKTTRSGRERHLHLPSPPEDTWQKAQPLLRNPVKGNYRIRMTNHDALPGFQAGLSALAQYSLLAEPPNPVVAVDRNGWHALQESDGAMIGALDEPDTIELEVWIYPPGLFAGNNLVDPLSLYLSLRDIKDDRIETALEQMIGDLPW